MTRFPTAGAPGLLGRHLPGQQRVRRPGQVHRDPTRKPLPEGALGAAAMAVAQHPGHLPGRQVPAHRRPPRPEESHRRRRARHPHRDLAHGPHRRPLRRPRRRLLHPPPPRTPKKHAMNQLQRLGYHVTLTPTPQQPEEGSLPRRGIFASAAHPESIDVGVRPDSKMRDTPIFGLAGNSVSLIQHCTAGSGTSKRDPVGTIRRWSCGTSSIQLDRLRVSRAAARPAR